VSVGATARLFDPQRHFDGGHDSASAECSADVRSAAICDKTRAVAYDEETWYSLMEYRKCRREFSDDRIRVILQVRRKQDLAGSSASNWLTLRSLIVESAREYFHRLVEQSIFLIARIFVYRPDALINFHRHGKWLREPLSLDPLSVSERICERKSTGALRLE
jgi:hypothetical protein